MDRSPNWCPICKRETDWLIVPSQPSIAQCKECGHLKEFPRLKVERPKPEKPSTKERPTIPSPKPIVNVGLALRVVLESVLGGFLLGGIWLLLGFLFMAEGNFILGNLFFIFFGITASTIGVYFVLCEAEEIAEKKLKKEIE